MGCSSTPRCVVKGLADSCDLPLIAFMRMNGAQQVSVQKDSDEPALTSLVLPV